MVKIQHSANSAYCLPSNIITHKPLTESDSVYPLSCCYEKNCEIKTQPLPAQSADPQTKQDIRLSTLSPY